MMWIVDGVITYIILIHCVTSGRQFNPAGSNDPKEEHPNNDSGILLWPFFVVGGLLILCIGFIIASCFLFERCKRIRRKIFSRKERSQTEETTQEQSVKFIAETK